MESFRIQQTSRGRIALERQGGALDPAGSKPRGGAAAEALEPLSRIIEALNERFGLKLGPEHRVTLEQIRSALDGDAGLDASARVNTRENVRLTFDPKVEDKIQEIVETNFGLYKRITDDPDFGRALKNHLFDDYIRRHRRVEELLKLQESKTLEFKSSLRWNLEEDRKNDRHVTYAALKTIAAFLNTEGRRPPESAWPTTARCSASTTTAWRPTTSSCATSPRPSVTASATGPGRASTRRRRSSRAGPSAS